MNADGCVETNEKGCNNTNICCHDSDICHPSLDRPSACFVECFPFLSDCSDLGDYKCAFSVFHKQFVCMEVCGDNDQCSEGFSCSANIGDGLCQPCWETGENCTRSHTCCDGLICHGTDVTESNPGTCQVPCGIVDEDCTSSETCCDGYICDGTDISESNPGTCKENKGFSLFDMSFSLKHLVGFAVVMVATGFL